MNNQVINVNHIYEQKQTRRSRWNCTLQCQSIIRILMLRKPFEKLFPVSAQASDSQNRTG